MRIALFSDTYPPQINGVATATYTLAKAMRENGHEILIVTVAEAKQKKLTFEDGIIRIPGVTVKRLYNYKFTWLYNFKAYKMIKDFNPDIIHVQTEAGVGIFGRICAGKLHVPLIYTYHTLYENYTYYVTRGIEPMDSIAKKFVKWLSTLVGDTTSGFTTTSLKTKRALRKYGVKDYINVIPNGLDLDMFKEENLDLTKIKEIKDKYSLNGKFTMLILGRMAKEKSNELLLRWIKNYIEKTNDRDLKILIVGDGPALNELENLAKELNIADIVSFVGCINHDEIPLYYRVSDLYISASTTETQGLTYNEAMASRLLVMARFDDNLVDAVIDGKTGFFFEDEESFIKQLMKIRALSDSEKETIISNAYKNNSEKFSMELFYERMLNVYNKALRKFW